MKIREPREWELNCLTGHDIVVDPLMKEIVNEAKQYQVMINEAETVTNEELDAILDDLNGRWPYHDQFVTVSGTLLTWFRGGSEDEEHDYSLLAKHVDEAKFFSQGFSIVDQSETEDEHEWTVGYLFGQGDINETPAPFMDVTRTFSSFALLDDVHIDGYLPSDAFAQTKAEYYLPKETQYLQARMFDANDIQDFTYILKGMTLYPQEKELTDGYNALIALLNSKFKLAESGLPSKLSIKVGDYVKVMGDDEVSVAVIEDGSERYCYPSRVLQDNVKSFDEENNVEVDKTRLVWCLEASVLASDGVWRRLVIPIDHLDHCTPLPSIS